MTSVRPPRIAACADDLPFTADERGFRVLSDAEPTPDLASRRARANAQGLPAELRLVMRREPDGTSAR